MGTLGPKFFSFIIDLDHLDTKPNNPNLEHELVDVVITHSTGIPKS